MNYDRADRRYSESETILVIDGGTHFSLRSQIASCSNCNPGAENVFVYTILDSITGSDSTCTSYFFGIVLRCPKCGEPIPDDGLVEWTWKSGGR